MYHDFTAKQRLIMESVGTTIQKARLQTGLSLHQVSADTCISTKILQAIEEDDFAAISSSFFYRSFAQQFATRVGVSPTVLEPLVSAAILRFPEPLVPGQEASLLRRISVKPLRRKREIRWLSPAISLGLVFLACSGLYAYWENFKLSAILAKTAIPLVSSPPTSTQQPTPAVTQSAPAEVADAKSSFRVELSAVERTWLSIQADGQQIFSGTLEVDQRKVLEGHQEGQVRTGNAGGISIVFNGKPIGRAGPHGSVRTMVFTRDNYQVLQPSSVPAFLT